MALVNVLELILFSNSTVTLLFPLFVTFILLVFNLASSVSSNSLGVTEPNSCNSACEPPFKSTPCSKPLKPIRTNDKSARIIGMAIKILWFSIIFSNIFLLHLKYLIFDLMI